MSAQFDVLGTPGFEAADILALAQKLRAESLVGYAWNVPERWEDANAQAKGAWCLKALRVLMGTDQ